jgi:hypothetical protein
MPRICLNEAMDFLKIPTSLHTRLAGETHFSDGGILQVIGEEFLELRGKTRIPVVVTQWSNLPALWDSCRNTRPCASIG